MSLTKKLLLGGGVTVFNDGGPVPSWQTPRTQMKNIEEALDLYHLSQHRFPSFDEDLEALTRSTPQSPAVVKEVPRDAWGRRFQYRSPGLHHPESFDLWSLGADGRDGTSDDVVNWQR